MIPVISLGPLNLALALVAVPLLNAWDRLRLRSRHASPADRHWVMGAPCTYLRCWCRHTYR